jgi:hypothetical protein
MENGMTNKNRLDTLLFVIACLAVLCCATLAAAGQGYDFQSSPRAGVIVHSKFGGTIFGYDLDRNGNEGILSEVLELSDGKVLTAVETFDAKTGKIIKVVERLNETNDNYVTWGVAGKSVGLVERDHVKGGFVDHRTFDIINPLSSNQVSGHWTPSLKKDDIIVGVSQSQESPNNAVLAFENGGSENTFVFGSNVGANTFGKIITLTDPNFSFSNIPVVALDSKRNKAVLGTMGGDPFGPPTMALADLSIGKVSEFQGLGIGYVNGIAVDPATGIACTTTNIDASVEFYDTHKKLGLLVEHLPGSGGNEFLSGGDVEFDPVHKLFLVEQYTSTGNTNDPQPRIYVYDEKGNLRKTIGGLQRIPLSPVPIAINPGMRTGFIIVGPEGTQLQSFKY